jgi:hypothetical protein
MNTERPGAGDAALRTIGGIRSSGERPIVVCGERAVGGGTAAGDGSSERRFGYAGSVMPYPTR